MKRSDVRVASKKRDREVDTKKPDPKPDHELFIQAYEKPTQIYKFLRIRFKHSPYFLYRNMSYMMRRTKKCTSSRNNVSMNEVCRKLNTILERASSITTHKFLRIKFMEFLTIDGTSETVSVETLLMKLCNKKRKENTCPVTTKSFGIRVVPSTSSLEESSLRNRSVFISTDLLSLSNGHAVKSYHLLIRVNFPTTTSSSLIRDNELNGPNAKKRKVCNKEEKSYIANLTVYDKRSRGLLKNGLYELLVHEWTQKSSSKVSHVNSSWETIPNMDAHETSPAFQPFVTGPKLKVYFCWTDSEDEVFLENGLTLNVINDEEISSNIRNSSSNKENNNPDNNGVLKVTTSLGSSNCQMVYQFLYSNNSRQQTEPYSDFHCPWCPKLDCITLYSLLKHLKLCHARFTFAYTEITNGARIDVALNEKYDGSYIGPSRDIAQGSKIGIFKRGPVRRAPVSKILVWRPKPLRRPKRFSLQEFLNEKDDNDGVDISGHNRLYHHTSTCLPIYPKEMDYDSESESDPKWLQKKTKMMIDDFTDVNDGEKELMKLWNLHVMKYGFVGDCQIPLAFHLFLETRGQELLQKNLYRNFVLHMCNLFDFGLINAVTVYTTIQRLQELIGEGTEISSILRESWILQRTNWLNTNVKK